IAGSKIASFDTVPYTHTHTHTHTRTITHSHTHKYTQEVPLRFYTKGRQPCFWGRQEGQRAVSTARGVIWDPHTGGREERGEVCEAFTSMTVPNELHIQGGLNDLQVPEQPYRAPAEPHRREALQVPPV